MTHESCVLEQPRVENQQSELLFNGERLPGLKLDAVPSRILRGMLKRISRHQDARGNNHSSYGSYATWSQTMAPVQE